MNIKQILLIELPSIKNSLMQYTSSTSKVVVEINNLIEAVKNDEVDIVKYLIDRLVIWYENNIDNIERSRVVNAKEHRDNFNQLIDFKNKLNEINNEGTPNNAIEKTSDEKSIFISHSSRDKAIGLKLVKFLEDIGVNKNSILFTSEPEYGIQLNESIFSFLKNKINTDIYVIYILSDYFYNSSACLNEMGACWITQKKYTYFYKEKFSLRKTAFINCCLDKDRIGIKITPDKNFSVKLKQLSADIIEFLNLKTSNEEIENAINCFYNSLKGE